MGKRRASRELALKVLFQNDVAAAPVEEALATSLKTGSYEPATADFARKLIETTTAHCKEIDQRLARYANQWSLERMANVDRSLLRMAVCEILYFPEIPHSVSVDEAVELAKKYSTADSSRFINGVLGSLLRDLEISAA